MNTRQTRTVRIALLAAAGAAGPALALPPLTPHLNDAAHRTWSGAGYANHNTDMHQHYNANPLPGVAGLFKTYAAWDNNRWRYDRVADDSMLKANGNNADYGHGYMDPTKPATYAFRASVPAMARSNFNAVVDFWEAQVNFEEADADGDGIYKKASIAWDASANLQGEIRVKFAKFYRSADGTRVPFPDDFPAPSDQDDPYEPGYLPDRDNYPYPPGPEGGPGAGADLDGTLAVFTPSRKEIVFNMNVPWYFRNAGDAAADHDTDGMPNIIDPNWKPDRFDFLTVAMHEFGHAIGLDHPNGAMINTIMQPTLPVRAGLGLQEGIFERFNAVLPFDAGTRDGARSLYTIVVPAPAPLAALGLGCILSARRRR